jgi:hypothetical protein
MAQLGMLLLGSGCSSTTDEPRAVTSTSAEYCQRTCAKAHVCNDAADQAACRSACQTELAAKPKLRGDFLAYVASCIESSSCAQTSAAKCKNEAQAQLAPSNDGRNFCTAYLVAGGACDASSASYSEQDCFEAAKSYDDSALEGANHCLSEPCEGLPACLMLAIPAVALPR